MTTTREDSDRHFRVDSEVTWRDEIGGRTRRYDGTPIEWAMDTENGGLFVLLTQEEAVECLEEVEQEYPEGEHRIRSVPEPDHHIRSVPESEREFVSPRRAHSKHRTENLTGYVFSDDADWEAWEIDGQLVKEVSLELPVDLIEEIEQSQMEAREYIGLLQDTADAVSEAPTPPSETPVLF